MQSIKVATGEKHLIDHFRGLNNTRSQAALKDRLFDELLESIFQNAVSLGTGVILILAGGAMREGTFTVGDFSLFVYYLAYITDTTWILGFLIARYKQVRISIDRMVRLMEEAPPKALVQHGPIYVKGDLPDVPYIPKTDGDRLVELEVSGLEYRHPNSEKGIKGIDLHLKRGSFTVITGQIGCGKTTLLRVLLGLLPMDEGEIRWNGNIVEDPASFFVTPRSAYTPQVPNLFSQRLRDNILMGLPEEKLDLAAAIRSAVLEGDVDDLEKGMDTMVGPKGIRLSGGQMQRTAAARMFVRDPELLVFDDLSSALDVETERTLWERLFGANGEDSKPTPTCLVVSHRRPALRHADHVIVLKDGVVEAEGRLDYLLETCEEMQRLWEGKVGRRDDKLNS